MAMVILPESELGKEYAKWNKPWRYEEFPRLLYKAKKRPDGRVSVAETDDKLFGGNPGAAEQWTRGCYMEVGDEYELQKALELGWRKTQKEALEHFEAKERALGEAAAVRAWEDRNMSEGAKAEAAVVEAETFEHVAEIPRQPIKRRGRPKGSKNKPKE